MTVSQSKEFQEAEAPRIRDIRYMKVVRLSALCIGNFQPQETYLGLISLRGWVDSSVIVRPEWLCHWKIPKKKFEKHVGNRTRDPPACSAVSKITAPPCVSTNTVSPSIQEGIAEWSVFQMEYSVTLVVWSHTHVCTHTHARTHTHTETHTRSSRVLAVELFPSFYRPSSYHVNSQYFCVPVFIDLFQRKRIKKNKQTFYSWFVEWKKKL